MAVVFKHFMSVAKCLHFVRVRSTGWKSSSLNAIHCHIYELCLPSLHNTRCKIHLHKYHLSDYIGLVDYKKIIIIILIFSCHYISFREIKTRVNRK